MVLPSEQELLQERDLSPDEVRQMIQIWCDDGDQWHFHSLRPDCAFNPRRDRYALVLENRTNGQAIIVYSDEEFSEISQELVKIVHGESILDREQISDSPSNELFEQVMKRAGELQGEGVAWHHHMLFPDCVFNQHRGQWNIAFESGEGAEIVEVLYDEEPIADLRRIEVAYFQ